MNRNDILTEFRRITEDQSKEVLRDWLVSLLEEQPDKKLNDWADRKFRPGSLSYARLNSVCRICMKPMTAEPGNPFVLNFGKEFAHRKCLDRME